jgi:FkbM family methyltransferase
MNKNLINWFVLIQNFILLYLCSTIFKYGLNNDYNDSHSPFNNYNIVKKQFIREIKEEICDYIDAFNDLKFCLNDHYVTMEIKRNYVWEEYISKSLIRLIKEQDVKTFFDIGANIGWFTLISLNNNIETHSFEPVKETYDILINNLFLNKKRKWVYKVNNFALGNSNKNCELNIGKDLGNSFVNCNNVTNLYWNSKGKVNINIHKLTNYLIEFNLNSIDIIKLDCQGCEFEVLRDLLENNVRPKFVIMEIWPWIFRKNDVNIIDELKFLLRYYNFYRYNEIDMIPYDILNDKHLMKNDSNGIIDVMLW